MSVFNRYDDRKDLGYATTNPKFQNLKKMGTSYPYRDPDKYESPDFEDEETEDAIHSKVSRFAPTDFGDANKADRSYFVGGNTKLSDCFFRTDKVLEEIFSLGDSMSPVPGNSRAKRASGGTATHSNVYGSSASRRFGSKRGYFSAPPDDKIDYNDEEEEQPIKNLKDLARKQSLQRGSFSL